MAKKAKKRTQKGTAKKSAGRKGLSAKMEKALNEQINEELFSGYLYLSMSACFAGKSFSGIASWFRVQALEEQIHASKIYDFILERGGEVELAAIKKPQTSWDTPLEAFEAALGHEQHITACINELVTKADSEKDYASKIFLDWFVSEQVEEEDTAEEVVDQLTIIGDNGYGLLMLDRELGQRAFVMPPANGEGGA